MIRESIGLTKGYFRAGPSRGGVRPIYLVDRHGCILHTEPICMVPDRWHAWFIKWLKRQALDRLFPDLLKHPFTVVLNEED